MSMPNTAIPCILESRAGVGVQLFYRVSCYYYMLMKELFGICLKGCGLVRRT